MNKMAEVRFTREEIEEVFKEKFNITKIEWDGDELVVDMDLEELEEHKKKQEEKSEPIQDEYENLTDLGQESPVEEQSEERTE